jgi:hypothetical protein
MRWAGYVARMRAMRNPQKIWSGILRGGDQLEDLGVYGRIILEWVLGKQGVKVLICLSIETGGKLF